MEQSDRLFSKIMDIIQRKLGDRLDEYDFPPPIFAAMRGEFLELDLEAGSLTTRFPVLETWLNPYGTMQGGMIAAAIDNTYGPLSVLVASPNVTRRLEITYSRPVTLEMGHVIVRARFLERQGNRLSFRADVRSPDGLRLARAKAVHWVPDE
jgi:acyl-coenzyme A thioesterase PaaI-like protein